ncbi:putative phd finger domain protein [Danaus plexippus plexippus]|uniref:Phd finger domain protein n=1 Tax=Danaus plexippus plexippus TaxID=278856 RepID=A0A212EXW1_DANPL|nr:putative phd finger domain protein [Danaus plexippus plexippus]
MAVKKCCVENCNSSSTRPEDIGVTYHKFPKDKTLRDLWSLVTHYKQTNIDSTTYVCSRHFCKIDFQIYEDSKYILRSDSIPSIFSWIQRDKDTKIQQLESNMDEPNISGAASPVNESSDGGAANLNTSSSSKESEGENVEAIMKFIEEQEQEIKKQQNESQSEKIASDQNVPLTHNDNIDNNDNNQVFSDIAEPMVIATSVMDMILSESEAKIDTRKNIKPIPQKLSKNDKGNSVSLSVGSKVEAKDYGEFWHSAQIVEVDYDEMEVLVHYENTHNKPDEWISVSSPRLRLTNNPTQSTPARNVRTEIKPEKEEVKVEEKPKQQFVVGERCLARWRDNRRFIATILTDLGNGNYEIMFDDGFKWKCTTSRMCKLKESKTEPLAIDTSASASSSSLSPIPIPGTGPTGNIPNSQYTFHTHLFDPTRDYLGSKSERREMKRKLNIKEIFNIGQKKQKRKDSDQGKPKIGKVKKARVIKKKVDIKPEAETEVKLEVSQITMEIKKEIPDAVASIIGTVSKDESDKTKIDTEINIPMDAAKDVEESSAETNIEDANVLDVKNTGTAFDSEEVVEKNDIGDSLVSSSDLLVPSDLGFQSEPTSDPVMEEEAKLEQFEKPDESKQEVIEKMKEVICKLEGGLDIHKIDTTKREVDTKPVSEVDTTVKDDRSKRKLSKIKRNKRLRMLQEKKVKKQVEKVKNELVEMRKQMEEMRKQMLMKTEEMARPHEMPESFLLPGEWCCKWLNGQPLGNVCEFEDKVDGKGLKKMSVQVEDKRLPPGWTKLMVRRSFGQSAGKWDVVLVGPENRRFHTKTDIRNYLEQHDDSLKQYEHALLDFGVHLKLSRRMGWYTTDGGVAPALVKRKKLGINRKEGKKRKKEKSAKRDISLESFYKRTFYPESPPVFLENPVEDDGSVYVGSMKVEVIDNLLRCPAEGCLKNFRNTTLLQMHIKHYHREMREMLGATPKVLDLARERTKPTDIEVKKTEFESKIIKVKLPKLPKRSEEPKSQTNPEVKEPIVQKVEPRPQTPPKLDVPIPRSQDSPKLRQALITKPAKRPKVLLPVRKPEPEEKEEIPEEADVEKIDFDDSSNTAEKPFEEFRRKCDKKRKCFSTVSRKPISEEDEWFGVNSDLDTRSSFPGSGTPDSKNMDKAVPLPVSSESNEEQKDGNMYMYTETGERIKIEHMKREEIINCHCGFREEDGLMVQCELCLCWQHALCHNIQKESEVPEKYTCSICLNPRRGRRSKRFLHDQDRLYEGLLPGAKPCETLRRSHELSANLLKIQDALHAMRVKHYVATKKDHPKLYLWAKDWESPEVNFTQERLNSDYSDLNIIINNIGKENLPLKPDEVNPHLDIRMPITEEPEDRFTQRDKQEVQRVVIPQPEAAIENSACRERLLRHVQRCQGFIDARLDSIEAQVAELESQDPSFEDDETADFFPRTKQTIQMLMRDLDTMEELGIIS